jgi:hypothetical protein
VKKHMVAAVMSSFGGEGSFSLAMGVSRVAVQQWIRDNKFPAHHIPWLEVLSEREFNRDNLPFDGEADDAELTKGQLEDRAEDLQRVSERMAHLTRLLREKRELLAAATA